jgi:hypothetical protein
VGLGADRPSQPTRCILQLESDQQELFRLSRFLLAVCLVLEFRDVGTFDELHPTQSSPTRTVEGFEPFDFNGT